ncbi:MAG: fused MFS/spermidine synthase, partial [Polyangiaceae bacterium]
PAPVIVALHLTTFFLASMVCHGRLANDRPSTEYLTEFFLWLSVGGVLGGLFNGLIAPALFDRLAEYPLVLVLAALARPSAKDDDGKLASDYVAPAIVGIVTALLILGVQQVHLDAGGTVFMLLLAIPVFFNYSRLDRPRRFALGIGAFLLAGTLYVGDVGHPLHRERNFFGEIRVTRDRTKSFTQIVHGDTVHGRQSVDPAERREPLAYYHRTGPLGQIFAAFDGVRAANNKVAVVGLGAGAMAPYAKPGEPWTFYEINPEVARVAQNTEYFTFLHDAFPDPALMRIELGDARLRLGEAVDHSFGLIALDAFSSDSIPVHLLTREALRLYASKLAPDGLLAFHISNRYLDLKPELAELAHDAGLSVRGRDDLDVPPELLAKGKVPSQWVAMARSDAQLSTLTAAGWVSLQRRPSSAVWTDDFSNVLRAFIF